VRRPAGSCPDNGRFPAILREDPTCPRSRFAPLHRSPWPKSDHLGLDQRARVIVRIVNGAWKLQ